MTFRKRTLQTIVLGGFLSLAAIVVISSAAYTIDEAEQAVIVQFGEPVGEPINEPGLHWKTPFIQEVRRYDKRILSWDGDVNQIPTLGREFIIVDTTARWRIVVPLLFLKSVRDEMGAQTRLDDIIDSVVRDKVSNTDLEEIVRSKDWEFDAAKVDDLIVDRDDVDLEARPQKGREELTREILAEARNVVPQYGIELVDVRIKRLNYINDVRSQVEDRMISERQRIAEQFRSEGRGRSSEIEGNTEREQREILSEAERRAEEIRGQADAEAARIYGESFGQDPEFYAFFRTLESYGEAINDNATLMIRADSDYFRYLQQIAPGVIAESGGEPVAMRPTPQPRETANTP